MTAHHALPYVKISRALFHHPVLITIPLVSLNKTSSSLTFLEDLICQRGLISLRLAMDREREYTNSKRNDSGENRKSRYKLGEPRPPQSDYEPSYKRKVDDCSESSMGLIRKKPRNDQQLSTGASYSSNSTSLSSKRMGSPPPSTDLIRKKPPNDQQLSSYRSNSTSLSAKRMGSPPPSTDLIRKKPPNDQQLSTGASYRSNFSNYTNLYWEVDFVSSRCDPTERVLPDEFSMAKEEECFNLWLSLAKAEAHCKLNATSSAENKMMQLSLEFNSMQQSLQERGWTYDALNRTFREFYIEIDSPTTVHWFTYVPLRYNAILRNEGEMNLHRPMKSSCRSIKACHFCQGRRYELNIRHPITLKNNETVSTLTSNLLRRYHGVSVTSIAVLILSKEALQLDLSFFLGYQKEGVSVIVCDILYEKETDGSTLGERVNLWLNAVLEKGVDLVVVTTAIPTKDQNYFDALDLDLFIPVYPVFRSNEMMISTPILIAQINGCRASCNTTEEIFSSLHRRACTVCGAILSPESADVSLSSSLESDWFNTGLNSLTFEGIERNGHDGRFFFLPYANNRMPDVRLANATSWCHHGWCSVDTRAALSAGMEKCRPKVIVELGSWYGTSSRYIIKRMDPGTTLYCVDYFKNNAIYGNHHANISSEDKMFFNFPRFESFVAGMENELSALPDDQSRRVSVVKMDIHEVLPYLHRAGVVVDMLFIDAEKKTMPLFNLINKARVLFPNITIVGDDHVFQTVQNACRKLREGGAQVLTLKESYMVLPNTCRDREEVRHRMQELVKKISFFDPGRSQIDEYIEIHSLQSIQKLKDYLFPNNSEEIRFGHRMFYPSRDNFPSLAFSIVKRLMALIKSGKNTEISSHLKALILQIVDVVPCVSMTEGRLTLFDYIARNVSFE